MRTIISLSTLRGKLGLCRHNESDFVGSYINSLGEDCKIGLCRSCGRLHFISGHTFSKGEYMSCYIVNGKLQLCGTDGTKYNVSNFINMILHGEIGFNRKDLENLLNNISNYTNDVSTKMETMSDTIRSLRTENNDYKNQVVFLESVIENSKVIPLDERLNEEDCYLHRGTKLISELLEQLLLNGYVFVPYNYGKLFKSTLSSLYFYNKMCSRWKWKNVTVENEKFVKWELKRKDNK